MDTGRKRPIRVAARGVEGGAKRAAHLISRQCRSGLAGAAERKMIGVREAEGGADPPTSGTPLPKPKYY